MPVVITILTVLGIIIIGLCVMNPDYSLKDDIENIKGMIVPLMILAVLTIWVWGPLLIFALAELGSWLFKEATKPAEKRSRRTANKDWRKGLLTKKGHGRFMGEESEEDE
jgi:phosphate/sulfate permease